MGRPASPDGRLPVVILGGQGHGRVIQEIVEDNPALRFVRFIGSGDELLPVAPNAFCAAAIAFGLIRQPAEERTAAFQECLKKDYLMLPLIHPTARVDSSAQLGRGVQVLVGAVVGADAVLGDGVVVNSNAVVSHDCILGAHTHIAPGALLAGRVHVGKGCLIGMGVPIHQGTKIGDGATVTNNKTIIGGWG